MFQHLVTAAFLFAAPLSTGTSDTAVVGPPAEQTYKIRQTVRLSEIPQGTKSVRWWIALPDDDRAQDVLDIAVTSAPGQWSLEREAENGNRFLYVEVNSPLLPALETVVEFTLRRRAVFVDIDPAQVGELDDARRELFAAELRLDSPHMAVSPQIQEIADARCGEERNIALQANLLLQHVAEVADHYSKDASKPKCGIGDAEDCMSNGGGCCTDLHSLFIALARARGIPTRLAMGYRLLPKNLDKDVDPGYRCWPEYFVPAYGWVPADIVEADALAGQERLRWLTGLSERRLILNTGREFKLNPPQASGPVNTMVIGYAELDGTPARLLPEGDLQPQLSRKVHFIEIESAQDRTAQAGGH